MTHGAGWVILLAFATHSNAVEVSTDALIEKFVDRMIDRLFDQALMESPLQQADLGNTTVAMMRTNQVEKAPKPVLPNPLKMNPKHATAALGSLLTAALVLTPTDEALAARTGGRMGGSAGFTRSMPRAPPPRASAPRTNVYINSAPSIGFGGGGMMAATPFGGGYGYSYSPFGGMNTGTYLGFSLIESLIREQQRQAYLQRQLDMQRQLGTDQAQIAMLQSELAKQSQKVDGIKAQAPKDLDMNSDAVKQLQAKLESQQKEIDAQNAQIKALQGEKAPAGIFR